MSDEQVDSLTEELEQARTDLAAARELLREARNKIAGAVEPDDVALNARIDAALGVTASPNAH